VTLSEKEIEELYRISALVEKEIGDVVLTYAIRSSADKLAKILEEKKDATSTNHI
jgi:DNA-binding GntR family transcriptional regulator